MRVQIVNMSLISSNVCQCYYLLFYSFFFCAVLVPTSVICFFVLARPTLSMSTPVAAVTPLVLEEFTRELISCLSPVQKALVCLGIRLGFRVGWEPDRVSLRSRTSNMRSASDHPDVVDAYLSSELAARRSLVCRPNSACL